MFFCSGQFFDLLVPSVEIGDCQVDPDPFPVRVVVDHYRVQFGNKGGMTQQNAMDIGSGDRDSRHCLFDTSDIVWNKLARYSLIVSISTPEEQVDLYTPIENLVTTVEIG